MPRGSLPRNRLRAAIRQVYQRPRQIKGSQTVFTTLYKTQVSLTPLLSLVRRRTAE